MVVTLPDYYRDFSCIAGDCPDSCCIGWQVVPDREHLEFYRGLQGPLGDELRQGIVEVEGEPSFSLCNGRCCMLREDGLCKIQYALGEEALSSVCGFYPRFLTELGLIREQGLSISCPEVARMILTRQDPLILETYETNEPLRYFHDVEPERLMAVRKGRDEAIRALQNRTLSLGTRMQILLDMGLQVEALEYDEPERTLSGDELTAFRRSMYDLFLSLEHLRPEWTGILEEGRKGAPLSGLEDAPCWEQLLVYYLFKYSLRSAMDDNFLSCISMAILSVILLQDLYSRRPGDLIYLVQLYAKETEHNEDNLDRIRNAVWDDPAFSPEVLSAVLRYYS